MIIVDDGNDSQTKNYLSEIARQFPDSAEIVSLAENCGKGAAFKAGIIRASERGFSHALQIDADGQHDSGKTAFFFEKAALFPDALICGFPEYDASAPSHRKNGRKFANAWSRFVTWNANIKDALCGFRVYPVEKTRELFAHHKIDSRMGFDVDILVRLIWENVPCRFYPIRVTYPSDGISNFKIVRDNIRISFVFTKLCCGMFLRVPILAIRKIKNAKTEQDE